MKIVDFGTLVDEEETMCDECIDFGEENPKLPSLYDGTIPEFDSNDIYRPTDHKTRSVEKIVEHNNRLMESETEKRYHDLADKSIKDSLLVRFASMRDMRQFENYYLRCYSYRGQANNVAMGEYVNSLGGHFVVTDSERGRGAVYKIIVRLFGDESNLRCDSILALRSIVNNVHDRMEYNEKNINISLIDSVVMESGVCWHFSRITSVLLNYYGIPTRIVTGINSDGYDHCWCESDVDGKLYTVDATNGQIWPGRYKHYSEKIR